ncbi:hypothetical protein B0T18DRAFT_242567 [Schizothecium vesticola]|uniref:Ricin B lectin domain-containing protein n=1 Tax=Schizothecium vesticola TaxID=314040 RepID=A0AA40BPX8_9PEZI|nr:hypothetical protein B0T18DRAFT_242567 [Schizothecium vesticola]
MRATFFSVLAWAAVASASRVVPGAGDALNKAAPTAQAALTSSSSTCTKRTRTVTAKRAPTIVAEPSAVEPEVALGAEIVDTTSDKVQALNTKKPIKANGKASTSTTSTTAAAAAQTTAATETDAGNISESSTLGTSTRRGRGQISAKTKPAKTTANAAGTAAPSADTSSAAATSTTAVAANSDTKTKPTRVRTGKGNAGASSTAAVDTSSVAAVSTTAAVAANTKTKTKPTKAATAKAGSSSISTSATVAVTGGAGGAGGIPTANPTTPVPVSRAGGNLQPSAAAEAHKRDAAATRAFSGVEIRAPNGQCLSVDPTAGDFRQNLIPVALVECSGTPNEKWDIVTAGKHNKAGRTPATLVVSTLTQGCISFDGRRQAGDTVTLFSCGGRADGSGETNADQLFPYIGQLSFAMAPTGQGNKTCVLPGGDGGRLESGPCPKDGSQLFSIFP